MNEVPFQLISVFGSRAAAGNPTGVVLGRPSSSEAAQAIAGRLGCPDTVFVWKEAERWHTRFFSPLEELSVCYQALLAAAYVVGDSPCSFVLGARTLAVERDEAGAWAVQTPRASLLERGTVETPFGPGRIIDAGRVRAYVLLDLERFQEATWFASEARSWLDAQQLGGLCLVAPLDGGRARLRVFTTSLGGGEDVATGGAVAGLPLMLGNGRLELDQGLGPFARRGALWVCSDDRLVRVGGATKWLIRGVLSADSSVAHT